MGFESWLERDHAMLLDFTPQVMGLLSQPLWLFWEDERGKRISHAPDYFARFEDGRGLVVDCRPLDRIDARSAAKFAAARAACEAVGWGYRVVGEVDPVRMVNVRWLAGYRHPRHGADQGVVTRLLALFSMPSPLVAQAALLGDPIAVLPTVFHLFWLGRLTADLSRRAAAVGCHPGVPVGGPVSGRPGPRAALRVADRVRMDGRLHTVVGLSGTTVRLLDEAGSASLVLLSHMLASEDFELSPFREP